MNILGPRFTISTAEDGYKVKQLDGNKVKYSFKNDTSDTVKIEPLEIEFKVGSADLLFDYEKRLLYRCRVFGFSDEGWSKDCLCVLHENLNKSIDQIGCKKLLAYSINEQRLAMFCENGVRETSKMLYCINMINFDKREHDQ